MNYVGIVNLVFFIISGLLTLYLFHFIFFAIVGMIHKKRFPSSNEYSKYGVVISAKDEENVIPRLINSIKSTDYPQDKLDIIIIAHNCVDNTASLAKSLGARVIVYNNENERTLGYAYHYAFKHIDVNKYDGFVFLNADNVLKKDYFKKLNDAFVYYKKNSPITTFRHALNVKDSALAATYAYYFATPCLLSYAGREVFNVSARVTGCGFLVPSRMLVDGWNYVSITEDIEFSNNKVLEGETIHYCDDAIFYDEQPNEFKVAWFQRLRWSKGQLLANKKFFGKFFKALFDKNKKNKMSLFICLTFNSFIPLFSFFLAVFQIVLLLMSPIFGISLSETFLFWDSTRSWFYNMFLSFNVGALFSIAKSIIFLLLYGYLSTTFTLIASRGKYKGQPFSKMLLGYLIFPFFIYLQIPLDLTSLFVKNMKWRKVPHGKNKN